MKRGFLFALALIGAHGVAQAGDTTEVVIDSRYSSGEKFMPAVNAARDAAAGFALSRAMVTNFVAKHCAVDSMHALRADEARCRWWKLYVLTLSSAKG